MNGSDLTPTSISDYLEMLRRQRVGQAQSLAQMLPPQGGQGMAPFAFQQPAQQAPMSFPQAMASPAPAAAPMPPMGRPMGQMQGPLLDEMKVRGFDTGAGSFGTAQEYADKFAGGDLSKVKSRVMFIDGQPINDYYTRGLLEAAPAAPTAAPAPDAATQDPNMLQRLFGFLNLPSLGG